MESDIFCKIINKEVPSDIVAEEENWIAFKDVHPQTPVHVLVVPKKHVATLSETDNANLLGELLLAAVKVAKKLNLGETGFRLIINEGKDSGQLVPHLHVHLLGGRPLGAKIVN